ncbi:MAG: hypothetical protein ACP5SK_04180 [Thermoprotei archaeon]
MSFPFVEASPSATDICPHGHGPCRPYHENVKVEALPGLSLPRGKGIPPTKQLNSGRHDIGHNTPFAPNTLNGALAWD